MVRPADGHAQSELSGCSGRLGEPLAIDIPVKHGPCRPRPAVGSEESGHAIVRQAVIARENKLNDGFTAEQPQPPFLSLD